MPALVVRHAIVAGNDLDYRIIYEGLWKKPIIVYPWECVGEYLSLAIALFYNGMVVKEFLLQTLNTAWLQISLDTVTKNPCWHCGWLQRLYDAIPEVFWTNSWVLFAKWGGTAQKHIATVHLVIKASNLTVVVKMATMVIRMPICNGPISIFLLNISS